MTNKRPSSSHGHRPRTTDRVDGRRRLSLVVLLLGAAVTLAALYQAQRALSAHRETSRRLVRDYGAFAAWSFRQHATESIRQLLRQELTPAVHPSPVDGSLGEASVDAWRSALASGPPMPGCAGVCLSPFHFRLSLRDPRAASFGGDDIDAELQFAIVEAVLRHAGGPSRPAGDFAVVDVRAGARRRLVAYALVGTDSTRLAAYGLELDSARVRRIFDDIFRTAELLPGTIRGNRANSDLLGVAVGLHAAQPLFVSSKLSAWADPVVETFDAQLGGLLVRASILGSAVAPLTGDALSSARLQLLAGMLILACALAAVAVYQIKRDSELAHMRSDFVSSVSHELRTPLAQIQLFLETLSLGRHRTAEQRDWILQSMQREVTRLTALVDNVLHFSRAERGIFGGRQVPTELAPYLDGLLREFAPLAAARDVTVSAHCPPGLHACLHPESFRQVLLNLLDNALKYGPKGQTVHVECAATPQGVRLSVDDEGPGVDPGEREHIFAPFRRGANAVGTVAVGSGIGLSVARDLVAWHSGSIRVERGQAGGARFVIELPRCNPEQGAQDDPSPAHTAAESR